MMFLFISASEGDAKLLFWILPENIWETLTWIALHVCYSSSLFNRYVQIITLAATHTWVTSIIMVTTVLQECRFWLLCPPLQVSHNKSMACCFGDTLSPSGTAGLQIPCKYSYKWLQLIKIWSIQHIWTFNSISNLVCKYNFLALFWQNCPWSMKNSILGDKI